MNPFYQLFTKKGLIRSLLPLAFGFCFLFTGCQKFLDIPAPPDKINKESAFASDATATAAITGIYSEMINNAQQFTSGFTTLYAGLSADELEYYTPGQLDEFRANEITEQNHSNLTNYFWAPAYKFIYSANLAIEQLEISTTLSPATRDQLLGEAKFTRAFCYFYLTQFFGDVPLVLSSDYRQNSQLSRTGTQQLYEQIIQDLTEAKAKLPALYPTADRARPNKWAATALLARTYLYLQNWEGAEREAGAVIQSGMYTLAPLEETFGKTSPETIWQLTPGNPFIGTWEAFYILPPSPSSTPTYMVTKELLSSFEADDKRKTTWIQSRTFENTPIHYPAKYKHYPTGAPVTEAYIVLRLAEQYLIRAEARLAQHKIEAAKADLDLLRQRAGLPLITAQDPAAMFQSVVKERQVELFAEWGHRWLDTKRLGIAQAIFGNQKPSWQPTDVLWPIPLDQINLNPALVQNPGY